MSNKLKRKLIFVVALAMAMTIGFGIRRALKVDLIYEPTEQFGVFDMGNMALEFTVVEGTIEDNGQIKPFIYHPESKVFSFLDIQHAMGASDEAEVYVKKLICSRLDYNQTIMWNVCWCVLIAAMTYCFVLFFKMIVFKKHP